MKNEGSFVLQYPNGGFVSRAYGNGGVSFTFRDDIPVESAEEAYILPEFRLAWRCALTIEVHSDEQVSCIICEVNENGITELGTTTETEDLYSAIVKEIFNIKNR